MFQLQDVLPPSHSDQRREVTNSVKGRHTMALPNIHGVLPPPPEEHHEAIDSLNTTVQGMQMQIH